MANAIPLTVENALVRSAMIEVRVLSIGKRQVTMAVFRQVPEESILTEDGGLAGVPWGWVNYWWDGAVQWGSGPLHVLWAKDGELRRSCVPRARRTASSEARYKATAFERRLAKTVGRAKEVAWIRGEQFAWLTGDADQGVRVPTPGLEEKVFVGPWRYDDALKKAIELKKKAGHSDDDWTLRSRAAKRLSMQDSVLSSRLPDIPTHEIEKERRIMEREAEEILRNEWKDMADMKASERAAIAIGREIDQLMAQWQASYETCKAAGQLFIAT